MSRIQPPQQPAVAFIPENLIIEARRPDLPLEARKKEPPRDKPLKKKTNQPHDEEARLFRKRKYETLRVVPRSNGNERQPASGFTPCMVPG
jgi:hypothetical protein